MNSIIALVLAIVLFTIALLTIIRVLRDNRKPKLITTQELLKRHSAPPKAEAEPSPELIKSAQKAYQQVYGQQSSKDLIKNFNAGFTQGKSSDEQSSKDLGQQSAKDLIKNFNAGFTQGQTHQEKEA